MTEVPQSKKRMSWTAFIRPGKGQRRVWDLVERLYGTVERLQSEKDLRESMIQHLRDEIDYFRNSLEEAENSHQEEINIKQGEIQDLTRENKRLSSALDMAVEMNNSNYQKMRFEFNYRPGPSAPEDVPTHPIDVKNLLEDGVFHPDVYRSINSDYTSTDDSNVIEKIVESEIVHQSVDSTQGLFLPEIPFTIVPKIEQPVYPHRPHWVDPADTQVLPLHKSPMANPAYIPGMNYLP